MLRANPELVAAAHAGDSQAIAQLLVACQPDLQRFARRTCHTSEDAEDAVQVALWTLHKKIGMLRSLTAFATWLFRIVERECYRLFRRAGYDRQAAEGAIADMVTPADQQSLRLDLSQVIATLPEAYRVVLILRDIDELTAPETAELLGIRVEAVKSRLHRARGMVRQELEEGGYHVHRG